MVTQEELEKMSPEEIMELQKKNCPFCKIVSGDIPSSKVYEDDEVLAILDINPAKKGHTVILPKQHAPIMPILPPQSFKKLFHAARRISKSIKKAMVVPRTTLFIANGGVAGQQANHFLFHILPREDGDGLSNFDIPLKEEFLADQEKLYPQLRANMNAMMQNHLKREGITFKKPASEKPKNPEEKLSTNNEEISSGTNNEQKNLPQETAELLEKRREQLAKFLEEQPLVRKLLAENPEEFKRQLVETPQLQPLFQGVDLDSLSKQLQGIDSSKSSLVDTQINQGVVSGTQQAEKSSVDTAEKNPEEQQEQVSQYRKPEVFLGKNPLVQRDRVFAYFKEKPQAKELLMRDLSHFKELLENRPDVQQIFEEVNIDKLAEKLIEVEEYGREQEAKHQTQQQAVHGSDSNE